MSMRRLPTALLIASGVLAAGAAVCVAAGLPAIRASAGNTVPGCATPDRLMAYLHTRNPAIEARFAGIAGHYMRQGEESRLRWDIAFFQMMVDTANLTFRRANGEPGAVRPAQNNFAGLGATGAGVAGESFADVATGVKAHFQHVMMYAGETISAPVAERTRKVQEWGLLASWQRSLPGPVTFDDLARRWAAGDASYPSSIAAVTRRFYEGFCDRPGAAAQRPEATDRRVKAAISASPGVDLARQANARADSDGARMALGALTHERSPVAGSEPMVGPLLVGPTIVTAKSFDASRLEARQYEAGPTLEPGNPHVAPAPPPQQAIPVMPQPKVAAAVLQVDPAAEAIRDLVIGKTFVIDAAFGATIPVIFRNDGTMRGRAGSLASLLGAATDEGRWWTARGRLCQRWNVWLDKETQCIKLRQSGPTIHWVRDDGKAGTARLASR